VTRNHMAPQASNPRMDEVTRAMAAAQQAKRSESFAARASTWLCKNVLDRVLPRRKTLVRAFLFGLLGSLPMLLLLVLAVPRVAVPAVVLVVSALYLLGAGEDVTRQLRWMKRMSGRGPIFWVLARLNRLSVRVARRTYGSKLDVLPKPPTALGTTARGAKRAVIKWIPQASSQYSTEKFEVQMRLSPRLAADVADEAEPEWIVLSDDLTADELELKPLVADIEYEVRVRAVNTKGASDWREIAFTTKQAPLLQDNEKAGGVGPGYTWQQSLRDDAVYVTVGPLPAGTRAKQLEVTVMPTTLSIRFIGGEALLSGELFGTVSAEEVEWELRDIPGAKGPRELQLQLAKTGKTAGQGPLWPQLLKAHPEVDVSGLKRVEKDLDEMLADLQKTSGMHAMDGIEYAKHVRKGLDEK